MKNSLPYIVYECTRSCNLDCKFCYNIWKRPEIEEYKTNIGNLPKETLTKLYKQVNVKNIAFTGGEPFLCANFLELPMYSRIKKTETFIITNGTVAKETDYSYLRKIGVNVFELPYLSFDSSIHNDLTNKSNAHESVINSIKTLKKLKANVVIAIVLTKKNIPQLEGTLKQLKDFGIEQIMLNRYNIGGNGLKHEKELIPTIKDFREAYKIADKFSSENDIDITSNVCTPFCIVNPKNFQNIQFTRCSNNIFEKPITLETNGNIRLCNHSPIVIGNIYEKNIYDILIEYNERLKNKKRPELCIDCELYNDCNGGCIGSSEQLGNKNKHDAIIDKYLERQEITNANKG